MWQLLLFVIIFNIIIIIKIKWTQIKNKSCPNCKHLFSAELIEEEAIDFIMSIEADNIRETNILKNRKIHKKLLFKNKYKCKKCNHEWILPEYK